MPLDRPSMGAVGSGSWVSDRPPHAIICSMKKAPNDNVPVISEIRDKTLSVVLFLISLFSPW